MPVCVTFDNMGPDDAEPALSGWNGEHVPDRVAELQDRGHEVGLHGWVHERWAELDTGAAAALLDRGLAALQRAGVRAAGFRAPGGGRGQHTAALLAGRGLRYDASLADDGTTAPSLLPEGIASVPFSSPQLLRALTGLHCMPIVRGTDLHCKFTSPSQLKVSLRRTETGGTTTWRHCSRPRRQDKAQKR